MFRLIAVCLMALFLSACASSGHEMTPSQLSQIEPGKTTLDDMNNMFGSANSQAYGSDGKLSMNWVYVYVGAFGIGMKQQTLAVLFNDDKKVEKYNVINSSPGGVRLGY